MAYTTINKSGDYFNTKLYTGNGSTSHTISGVGFEAGLTWIKGRNFTSSHHTIDQVRGGTKNIMPDNTGAEQSDNMINSWNSDGFNLNNYSEVNSNTNTFASWNWKAGTTSGISTDSYSTITPTSYSFNATNGFSIVKYTGNGTAGAGVPHGLAVAPKMVMVKILSGTSDWRVYHVSQGATKEGLLNTTDAFASASTTWNGWLPDATNFYLGTNTGTNGNNSTYVAYCFTNVTGFSKCGSYTGNGNSDGPFIYLGFKPAFVITKRTDGTSPWQLKDSARATADGNDGSPPVLEPNSTSSEATVGGWGFDFLSNGFKQRETNAYVNGSGVSYIYMAFAEAPLVGTNNVPCTAR